MEHVNRFVCIKCSVQQCYINITVELKTSFLQQTLKIKHKLYFMFMFMVPCIIIYSMK